MSLWVTLYITKTLTCDCGKVHVIESDIESFDANITHNLNKMADAAGIYDHIWRPEEIGITTAKELIEPLTKGLADFKARPEYYEEFSASNGWGTYEQFVPWVEKYLNACIEYPESTIHVSR